MPASIGRALKEYPPPWRVKRCGQPGCWCGLVVTTAGLDNDSMEGCIIAAGDASYEVAEFIVQAANVYVSPGPLVLSDSNKEFLAKYPLPWSYRKCWSDKPEQPCWCREIHCNKEEDSEVIGYGTVNEGNAALICDAVNLIERNL